MHQQCRDDIRGIVVLEFIPLREFLRILFTDSVDRVSSRLY